jgi:hypothetical protein
MATVEVEHVLVLEEVLRDPATTAEAGVSLLLLVLELQALPQREVAQLLAALPKLCVLLLKDYAFAAARLEHLYLRLREGQAGLRPPHPDADFQAAKKN